MFTGVLKYAELYSSHAKFNGHTLFPLIEEILIATKIKSDVRPSESPIQMIPALFPRGLETGAWG
jgi:hypothetical protein